MTLGVTNGTQNGGLITLTAGQGYAGLFTTAYNTNVGTTASVVHLGSTNQTVGITNDFTKSGIVVESDIDIKLIIKY